MMRTTVCVTQWLETQQNLGFSQSVSMDRKPCPKTRFLPPHPKLCCSMYPWNVDINPAKIGWDHPELAEIKFLSFVGNEAQQKELNWVSHVCVWKFIRGKVQLKSKYCRALTSQRFIGICHGLSTFIVDTSSFLKTWLRITFLQTMCSFECSGLEGRGQEYLKRVPEMFGWILRALMCGVLWDLKVARILARKGCLPLQCHPKTVLVLNVKKVDRLSSKALPFSLLLFFLRHWWNCIAFLPLQSNPSLCPVFRQRQVTMKGAWISGTCHNRSISGSTSFFFALIAVIGFISSGNKSMERWKYFYVVMCIVHQKIWFIQLWQ